MAWLPSTAVRERYRGLKQNKISFRTLDRWVERGFLPPPVYIGGRRYWSSEQLEAHDAARLEVANPSLPTARETLDAERDDRSRR